MGQCAEAVGKSMKNSPTSICLLAWQAIGLASLSFGSLSVIKGQATYLCHHDHLQIVNGKLKGQEAIQDLGWVIRVAPALRRGRPCTEEGGPCTEEGVPLH